MEEYVYTTGMVKVRVFALTFLYHPKSLMPKKPISTVVHQSIFVCDVFLILHEL